MAGILEARLSNDNLRRAHEPQHPSCIFGGYISWASGSGVGEVREVAWVGEVREVREVGPSVTRLIRGRIGHLRPVAQSLEQRDESFEIDRLLNDGGGNIVFEWPRIEAGQDNRRYVGEPGIVAL